MDISASRSKHQKSLNKVLGNFYRPHYSERRTKYFQFIVAFLQNKIMNNLKDYMKAFK